MSKSDLNLLRQSKATYGTEFENHLFDQYKLYVEMADRISARRMLANSFFVGVHTTLTIAFTVLLKENVLKPTLLIFAPFVALMLFCYVWERVVNSYRQLNSGKYKVVHVLEQMLPVAPYDAEWGQVLFLVEIIEAGDFNQQQARLAIPYRVSSPFEACA